MPLNSDTEFEKVISGTIAANGATITLSGPNGGTTGFQLSGTWTGTLIAEGSQDGTTYTTLAAIKLPGFTFLSSFTANGLHVVDTNTFLNVRIRATSWTSGTVTITAFGSDVASLLHARSFLFGADGTQIGNTGDKLKVDANITSGQLVPTISTNLRLRVNTTPINLPNTGAYVTIYTRSGAGLFFGFQADFNSANINVRLTLDGGAVFTLKIADIKLLQFNDTSTTRMQMGGFLATVGNTLDFSSRFAIPYTTSVLIEAAVTDTTAHQNSNYIVIHTED